MIEGPSTPSSGVFMHGIIAALWRRSIWAPGAIPKNEWEYRNIKRMLLPGIYFTMSVVGLLAGYLGIPALQELFHFPWATITSLVIAVVSLATFFGEVFPKLWKIESIGGSIMFGALCAYVVAILVLVLFNHDFERAYVGVLAIVPASIILWRLYQLKEERIKRLALKIIEEAA